MGAEAAREVIEAGALGAMAPQPVPPIVPGIVRATAAQHEAAAGMARGMPLEAPSRRTRVKKLSYSKPHPAPPTTTTLEHMLLSLNTKLTECGAEGAGQERRVDGATCRGIRCCIIGMCHATYLHLRSHTYLHVRCGTSVT